MYLVKSWKIFLFETVMLSSTKFGMIIYLVGIYQLNSNYRPAIEIDPARAPTTFKLAYIVKTIKILFLTV